MRYTKFIFILCILNVSFLYSSETIKNVEGWREHYFRKGIDIENVRSTDPNTCNLYIVPDYFVGSDNEMPIQVSRVPALVKSEGGTCYSAFDGRGREHSENAQSYRGMKFHDLVNIYVNKSHDNGGLPILAHVCMGFGVPILVYYALQRLNIQYSALSGVALAVFCAALACKKIYTGSGLLGHSAPVSNFKHWLETEPWSGRDPDTYWRLNKGPKDSVEIENAQAFQRYSGIAPDGTGIISNQIQQDFQRALAPSNKVKGVAFLSGSAAAASYLSWLYMKNKAFVSA